MSWMSDSIAPRSDQMNADDLLSGEMTLTIKEVRQGTEEQPWNVYFVEFPRPYRPSKTMRRIMVLAWTDQPANYVGKRLTLFRDPNIRFGKDQVGGIRIKALSEPQDGKPINVSLTATRGKKEAFRIAILPASAPTSQPVSERDLLRQEWQTADPERKKAIEAEVARLNAEASE